MNFIIRDGAGKEKACLGFHLQNAGKEKACLGFHLQKDSLDLQCHSAS